MNHEKTRQHRRRTCSCTRQEALTKSKLEIAARPKVKQLMNSIQQIKQVQDLIGMKVRNYS